MSDEESTLDKMFNPWIGLIAQAYAVVQIDEIERDGKIVKATQISLNECTSTMYNWLLQNYYQNFQEELKKTLDNVHNRFDKLNLLTPYLAEVAAAAALFVKEDSGITRHVNFQFQPLAGENIGQNPGIDETCFGEVYAIMEYSLKKMTVYLTTVQQNILSVKQEDIALPVNLLRDEQSSNIDQPFAFFDYFFSRGGLTALRQKFIDESWEEGGSFDEKNDCRHEQILLNEERAYSDGDEMEIGWRQTAFADALKQRLMEELNRSSQLVCNHLDSLKTWDEIQLRLKYLLSGLNYYSELVRAYPLYQAYEICSTVIVNLKGLIFGKYRVFIPKELLSELSHGNGTGKKATEIQRSDRSAAVTSFRILGKDPETLITMLFNSLKKERLIAGDTDRKVFENAFNGSEISEPQNIRWIAKSKNGQISKKSLFYLLNSMAKEGLVLEDTTNADFIKQVGMIFCNADGERLQHLHVSNANTDKSSTIHTRKIDEIIKSLKGNMS